jgi:hypothetical protein
MSKVALAAGLGGACAALWAGKPTGTRRSPKVGAAMMKMTKSTNITSTMGVTLMSLMGLD